MENGKGEDQKWKERKGITIEVLIRKVLRRIVNYKQTVPDLVSQLKRNARWILWAPSSSRQRRRRRLVHYELQSPTCDVRWVVNSIDYSSCRSTRKIVPRWQRQPECSGVPGFFLLVSFPTLLRCELMLCLRQRASCANEALKSMYSTERSRSLTCFSSIANSLANFKSIFL